MPFNSNRRSLIGITKLQNREAAGPDKVVVEMLIALHEDGVNLLWKLFNKIYETGQIPTETLKSVFIAIPKKPYALECGNHRTISLMSHTLKLLLKIILRRIRRKLLPQKPVYQYGFMPDRGTRNAIFVIRTRCERSTEHEQDVFLCFDYQKAFDKVRHSQLLTILKQIGVDDKDFRIIRNLYYEQKAVIKQTEGFTGWTNIKRGVSQNWFMSPDLFNLCSELILRELKEVEEGIQVNGRRINNISYADDTMLLASLDAGL